MTVQRRHLKNADRGDDCEVFEKALAFKNTNEDSVIVLYGILKNGNFWGHRQAFDQQLIYFPNFFEIPIDDFWKLVDLPEVVEIDVTTLPGLKA